MSSFSDLLSYHIHNSGKSKIQIAEAIGMPRTNFQKISTGARKPQDEHTLEKIMNELFLSVKEKKELWEAFHKDTTGFFLYEEYLECIRFFKTLAVKDETCFMTDFISSKIHLKHEVTKLSSRTDLTKALLMILHSIKEIAQTEIKLLVQPEHSFLLKLFISFAKDHQNIHVSHIVCFDHHDDVNESYAKKNMQRVTEIIELMLSSPSYECSYFYDNRNIHFKEASLFPNCMLTDNCLLVFDELEEKGFLSINKDLIELYNEKFFKIKEQAVSVFSHPMSACALSHNHDIDSVITYGPGEQTLHQMNTSAIRFFFTQDGINTYVLSRLKSNDPSHILQAEFMLHKIKNCILSENRVFLLKNNFIDLCREFSFYFGSKIGFVLKYTPENDHNKDCWQIHEQSIVEAFHRFINYLPASIFCFSKDETLQFLDDLLAACDTKTKT